MKIDTFRLKNHRIYWILLVLSQIVSFVAIHEASYRIYAGLAGSIESDLTWGIYLRFVLGLYVVTIVILGLVILLVHKLPIFLGLVVEAIIVTLIGASQFDYRPYRTLMLLISMIVGVFLPFLIFEVVLRTRQSRFH